MNKYALCIGINNYPGTDSDLSGCVNDAKDWSEELTRRGFIVKQLLDKRATQKGMKEAMAAHVAMAKDGDLVVVQYSGHGSYVPDEDGDEPDGVDECLCPHDIESKGPITDDDLFDLFSQRRAGARIVMVSDSCHSGTVARFAPGMMPGSRARSNAPQLKVRFLPPQAFLSRRDLAQLGSRRAYRRASPPGRYAALLIAGCQDTEYSFDAHFDGRSNGAFTYAALNALKSLSPRASYLTWFKEIRKFLPTQQYPQSPNLFGSTRMKAWRVFS